MSKDYYKILGVSKNASQDEIKRAYRGLAHQYHPDKAGGDEQKFKEINEAYQVLGDSKKRNQYDQYGSTFENVRGTGGFSGFGDFRDFSGFAEAFQNGGLDGFEGFTNFGDIFGDFFGGGRKGRQAAQRGNDISVDIEISLEEVFSGVAREIEINKNNLCVKCGGNGGEPGTQMKTCDKCGGQGRVRQQRRIIFGSFIQESICDKCAGQGKTPEKNCGGCGGRGVKRSPDKISINIPAGIEDGGTLRLFGKGEAIRDGIAGDLYVVAHIKTHKLFKRKGADLYYDLPLKFTQLVVGSNVDIPTIDGEVKIKISAGIEVGKMLKLKGKGLPRMGHYGRGDMYIKMDVIIPKRLSAKAKKLLEELDKEL